MTKCGNENGIIENRDWYPSSLKFCTSAADDLLIYIRMLFLFGFVFNTKYNKSFLEELLVAYMLDDINACDCIFFKYFTLLKSST